MPSDRVLQATNRRGTGVEFNHGTKQNPVDLTSEQEDVKPVVIDLTADDLENIIEQRKYPFSDSGVTLADDAIAGIAKLASIAAGSKLQVFEVKSKAKEDAAYRPHRSRQELMLPRSSRVLRTVNSSALRNHAGKFLNAGTFASALILGSGIAPFDRVPNEIIYKIFSYLKIVPATIFALTNKTMFGIYKCINKVLPCLSQSSDGQILYLYLKDWVGPDYKYVRPFGKFVTSGRWAKFVEEKRITAKILREMEAEKNEKNERTALIQAKKKGVHNENGEPASVRASGLRNGHTIRPTSSSVRFQSRMRAVRKAAQRAIRPRT